MIDRDDLPAAPRREPAPYLRAWFDGDETCPVCLQLYAVETEVRCIDCDQPHCAFCVVSFVSVETTVAEFRCATCCEESP